MEDVGIGILNEGVRVTLRHGATRSPGISGCCPQARAIYVPNALFERDTGSVAIDVYNR
jgi:hypothetical protein